VAGDEVGQADADKVVVDVGREGAEHGELCFIVAGQRGGEGIGGLMKPIHQLALFDSFKGKREKAGAVKTGSNGGEMVGEMVVAGGVEPGFEGNVSGGSSSGHRRGGGWHGANKSGGAA